MNNDAKLQKVVLGPDWIDLSFGEPKVVMDALIRQLNRFGDPFKMPQFWDLPKWEYQPAAGKQDLVKILEEKYDARVVVCNGAKQALAGGLYAFRQAGIATTYSRRPFYPAHPSLVRSVGLGWSESDSAESSIITTPNNPDGSIQPSVELITARTKGPLIHDAAYYTEIYLPEDEIPIPLGDIQVFSASKMYGVSGLRVGYAVVHNEKYYADIVDYIEQTTAGVSTASQDIVRNIEVMFQKNPSYYREFMKEARASIVANRNLLNLLNPNVLQVHPSQSNSMFAWCTKGPLFNSTKVKVHMLDGSLFGASDDMVRMNIAVSHEDLKKAIERLNETLL